MIPNRRAIANCANAQKSTGPKTPEGKKRASLNAVRHGLTGQIVVLPGEDLQQYQRFCQRFHASLKPVGILEEQLAQTIAGTQWRLNRMQAMESNLFALGFEDHSAGLAVEDPAIHCALAQARTVQHEMDQLARLSLYEQRLTRTLHQTLNKLKEIQAERQAAEATAYQDAAELRNLQEAAGEPWQPSQDGFEFSSGQLAVWMDRRQRRRSASTFAWNGELPARPQPEPLANI